MIQYSRETAEFDDPTGCKGRFGVIVVGPLELQTIERAEGFKWLRPGKYDCEMGIMIGSDDSASRAIRVLGEYSKGRIYIHKANYPNQLSGCIAVGMKRSNVGLIDSAEAMDYLFDALGGWELHRPLGLEVSGAPV